MSTLEIRKTNVAAAIAEVNTLKARGVCNSLNTYTLLSGNPSNDDFRFDFQSVMGVIVYLACQ